MNISKTKRNFIGLNTLFVSVCFVQYLYVRYVSAACSAKDVTAVFGNKNGKDDSFDNSSLDLLPCRA